MKTAIAVIFLFVISNHSFAQGIYTEPNSGLTVDYPKGWEDVTVDEMRILKNDQGFIYITSKIEEEKMDPEALMSLMNMDKDTGLKFFDSLLDDKAELIDYGMTQLGNSPSFYIAIDVAKDLGEGEIQYFKVKVHITTYGDYSNTIFMMSFVEYFDSFVYQAEDILSTMYFQ